MSSSWDVQRLDEHRTSLSFMATWYRPAPKQTWLPSYQHHVSTRLTRLGLGAYLKFSSSVDHLRCFFHTLRHLRVSSPTLLLFGPWTQYQDSEPWVGRSNHSVLLRHNALEMSTDANHDGVLSLQDP